MSPYSSNRAGPSRTPEPLTRQYRRVAQACAATPAQRVQRRLCTARLAVGGLQRERHAWLLFRSVTVITSPSAPCGLLTRSRRNRIVATSDRRSAERSPETNATACGVHAHSPVWGNPLFSGRKPPPEAGKTPRRATRFKAQVGFPSRDCKHVRLTKPRENKGENGCPAHVPMPVIDAARHSLVELSDICTRLTNVAHLAKLS